MPTMTGQGANDVVHHATTVAVAGCGLMIVGPTGSGKSSLALELMAFGAGLVADDRTRLWVSGRPTRLWADAPAGLPPLIEARGIGLLPADRTGPVPLVAVVDMMLAEPARLPEPRWTEMLGQKVALFHGAENAHLPYALLQYLKAVALADQTDDT